MVKETLLKCMPHAQARVRHNANGSITLVSYGVEVADIDTDNWLTIHDWPSPTTRRHIVAFIDEYAYGLKSRAEQERADTGSYQTAKALYEGKMKLDITTGEVVDLEEVQI